MSTTTITSSTLQQSLDRLAAFAASEMADQYQATIALIEAGGAILTVHYTGSNDSDVPRESHLFFSDTGLLSFALVYCPTSYLRAIDEGLTYEQAEVQSRRMVGSLEDVLEYFCGRAYHLI